MNLLAIIPWALFGITLLFTVVFIVWAWRASGRANRAEAGIGGVQQQLSQMEARALAAEGQINEARQRAQAAEQQVGDAEQRAQRARDEATNAAAAAANANQEAQGARDRARDADAALQKRRNAAEDLKRQAEQRARSLFEWAKQQWEGRRETDRQTAQAEHGSFQAQLERFLALRAMPVSFRAEADVDRQAAPIIERYAQGETVQVEGDLVKVTFKVDASLGFRA